MNAKVNIIGWQHIKAQKCQDEINEETRDYKRRHRRLSQVETKNPRKQDKAKSAVNCPSSFKPIIYQIKSNQIYLLKKKQQDTKAGKPALTWAQQKGTIKQ